MTFFWNKLNFNKFEEIIIKLKNFKTPKIPPESARTKDNLIYQILILKCYEIKLEHILDNKRENKFLFERISIILNTKKLSSDYINQKEWLHKQTIHSLHILHIPSRPPYAETIRIAESAWRLFFAWSY